MTQSRINISNLDWIKHEIRMLHLSYMTTGHVCRKGNGKRAEFPITNASVTADATFWIRLSKGDTYVAAV